MSPAAKVTTEAAGLLRRLLAEVDAGRLDAHGRAGARLRHRIEGAVAALEQVHPPR